VWAQKTTSFSALGLEHHHHSTVAKILLESFAGVSSDMMQLLCIIVEKTQNQVTRNLTYGFGRTLSSVSLVPRCRAGGEPGNEARAV